MYLTMYALKLPNLSLKVVFEDIFYLFERVMMGKQQGRTSLCWFTPQMVMTAGIGSGQRQEPRYLCESPRRMGPGT